MEASARWAAMPDRIQEVVIDRVGAVARIEPLGGMSSADVMRVVGRTGTRVVKRSRSDREVFVYRDLAPALANAGVRIPACDDMEQIASGGAWLVLEHVPRPLSADWTGPDADMLDTLLRLHALPPSILDPIGGGFRPAWDEALDRVADSLLPSAALARLDRHRATFVELGQSCNVISGDPNPLNWGRTMDGHLVLMDWDRVGTGHPGIDLAITIPGMGKADAFQSLAVTYATRGAIRGIDWETPTPRQLMAVKAWTMLGLLAEAAVRDAAGSSPPGDERPDGRLIGLARELTTALPGWLEQARGL